MVLTREQEKAMFAKKNQGTPRAETKPTFLGRLRSGEKAVAERLRKRFRPTAEELRIQRGKRLQTEAKDLEQAKLRTQQLELESKVEREREKVRTREDTARQQLKEIDVKRREKTFGGRVLKAERRLVSAGLKKLAETPKRPRRRKRQAQADPEPEDDSGFFGIGNGKSGRSKEPDFFRI